MISNSEPSSLSYDDWISFKNLTPVSALSTFASASSAGSFSDLDLGLVDFTEPLELERLNYLPDSTASTNAVT